MQFQGMATPCSPTRRAFVRNEHLPGHTAMMPRTVALKLGKGGAVVAGCGQAPRAGAGGDGARYHQPIDMIVCIAYQWACGTCGLPCLALRCRDAQPLRLQQRRRAVGAVAGRHPAQVVGAPVAGRADRLRQHPTLR